MKKQVKLLLTLFAVVLGISFINTNLKAQTDFRQNEMTTNFTQGYDVCTGDINSDGFEDIAAVAKINGGEVAYWLNDGEQNFTMYIVRQNFDGARSVRIVDLDKDGEKDLIAAAWLANKILWWKNDGNENFTEYSIDTNFIGAHTVDIKDVNDDGELDVLCSGFDYYGHEGEIAWWENDGNENWEKHLISDRFQQSPFIYGEDMDGDDDMDVIACGELNDEVYWWENQGNETFAEHMIDEAFDAAHTVLPRDIDGDNDMDILGAACMSSKVAWWENTGYNQFVKHDLGAFPGALWLDAGDMDMDGKIDLVSAGMSAPKLAVWYNQGDNEFTMNLLESGFTSAFVSLPMDMDRDTDLDIVAIGYNSNKISWFMNQLINPDYFMGPESVAFDHDRQRYLVSCAYANKVVQVDKTTHQQQIFIDDIASPLGNCIHDGTFYVSVGQYLKSFDLETGEELFSTYIPCIQHLDGMTCDNNGYLYVIDTGGKIHKVDLATGVPELIVDSGLTNAIQDCIFDPFNNRLLSVGYAVNAPIQAIDLESYEVTTATATPFGYYDGITIDQFGNVYLASHYSPGKIIKYEADLLSYEVISTGHNQPAGLDYNQYDNMLVVPNFTGNSVDWLPIQVTGVEEPRGQNPLHIYPNPNHGKFMLKWEIPLGNHIGIRVVNNTGSQVLHQKLDWKGSLANSAKLNLSNIPEGIYFLTIDNGINSYTEKLVINK
nr:VCBS repeat-containing protein [Bacteroidota bacterium]